MTTNPAFEAAHARAGDSDPTRRNGAFTTMSRPGGPVAGLDDVVDPAAAFERWNAGEGREPWHAYVTADEFSDAVQDAPGCSEDEVVAIVERRAREAYDLDQEEKRNEPIEVALGDSHLFGWGDHPGIDHAEIVHDEEGYRAGAVVRAGSLYEIFADGLDEEGYERHVSATEHAAAMNFLRERYDADTEVDDEGTLLVRVHGPAHEEPLSEGQASEETYPLAARVLNETDPGTYGHEFVGRLVREHLDEHSFLSLQTEPERAESTDPVAAAKVAQGAVAAFHDSGRMPTDQEVRCLLATCPVETFSVSSWTRESAVAIRAGSRSGVVERDHLGLIGALAQIPNRETDSDRRLAVNDRNAAAALLHAWAQEQPSFTHRLRQVTGA